VTTLYIAERGCYEDRYIAGIYDSPERAIGALHQEGWTWKRVLWHFRSNPAVRGGGHEQWQNDQDWENSITIYASTVTDAGEVRPPDVIVEFWDGQSDHLSSRELTAEEADAIVRDAP
jgi:hypothetical protein